VTLEDANNFEASQGGHCTAEPDLEAVRRAPSGIAELPDRDTAWVSGADLALMARGRERHGMAGGAHRHDRESETPWLIDDANKTIKAHVEWIT
jgi:hypothetical protein